MMQASNSPSLSFSSITNAEQLEQVLQLLLTPNSASVKLGEEYLKVFCKQESCVPALIQQIQITKSDGIKQLAAVLVRSRIPAFWSKLEANLRQQLKAVLLQNVLQEKFSPVRNALVGAITAIASIEVPKNNWTDLPKFLVQCVDSTDSIHREIGMLLCGRLLEGITDYMKQNISHIYGIFAKGIKDSSYNVRTASLKGLQSLAVYSSEDRELDGFKNFIPGIIEIIKECLSKSDETTAAGAFEIFQELVERDSEVLVPFIAPLVQFMIEVANNTNFEHNTRDKAMSFVGWVISYKSSVVVKNNLVEPIINICLKMMTEPEEDEDSQDTDGETTPFNSALQVMDELAIDVPSKYVFNSIMQKAAGLVQSQDHNHRRAGIAAVGIIAEGCREPLKKHLQQLVPAIINACNDSNMRVRQVACLALGSFSEYLAPEIIDYHGAIMPAVIKLLTDPSPVIKKKTLYVVEWFFEYLGDKIAPYLTPLMDVLVSLLKNGDKVSQEVAISGITNAAIPAKHLFLAYAPAVLTMMKQLMQVTSHDDMILLRGQATECAGLVFAAIGKDNSLPMIQPFMELAIAGFKLNNVVLREYTYHFLSNVSESLGVAFEPYLNSVIEYILHSSANDEGTLEKISNEGINTDFIKDDDDEDFEDTGADVTYKVKTAYIEEKSAAISCLGYVAKACGPRFSHYLEKAFEVLLALEEHIIPDIRREMVKSMRKLIYVVVPEEKADIQNTKENIPLRSFLSSILDVYLERMTIDDDKETVARCCEAISSICEQLGYYALQEKSEAIISCLLTLFQRKAPCNNRAAELDEDADHDVVLIDAVADCVDDVAKVLGPLFAPHFPNFFAEIQKYCRKSKSEDDRIMSIGTLAEVCNAIQSSVVPYANKILEIVVSGLQDESEHIRRNSVYCFGVLAYYAKEQVAPYISQILPAFQPIFANMDDTLEALVDNAVSALARIILAQHKVPLDQLVAAMVTALPLREDYQEYEVIFQCLIQLISQNEQSVMKYVPKIIGIMGDILNTDKLTPKAQKMVEKFLFEMRSAHGSQLQAIIQGLDNQVAKEKLIKLLQ